MKGLATLLIPLSVLSALTRASQPSPDGTEACPAHLQAEIEYPLYDDDDAITQLGLPPLPRKAFRRLSSVYHALSSCANISSLDLRIARDPASDAVDDGPWNFEFAPQARFSPLTSMKIAGYDFDDYWKWREDRRAAGYDRSWHWEHTWMDLLLGRGPSRQVFAEMPPGPAPERYLARNLDRWLQVMDWSVLEVLEVRDPGPGFLKRMSEPGRLRGVRELSVVHAGGETRPMYWESEEVWWREEMVVRFIGAVGWGGEGEERRTGTIVTSTSSTDTSSTDTSSTDTSIAPTTPTTPTDPSADSTANATDPSANSTTSTSSIASTNSTNSTSVPPTPPPPPPISNLTTLSLTNILTPSAFITHLLPHLKPTLHTLSLRHPLPNATFTPADIAALDAAAPHLHTLSLDLALPRPAAPTAWPNATLDALVELRALRHLTLWVRAGGERVGDEDAYELFVELRARKRGVELVELEVLGEGGVGVGCDVLESKKEGQGEGERRRKREGIAWCSYLAAERGGVGMGVWGGVAGVAGVESWVGAAAGGAVGGAAKNMAKSTAKSTAKAAVEEVDELEGLWDRVL